MSIMLMVPLEKVKHRAHDQSFASESRRQRRDGPESREQPWSSKEAIRRTHARIKEKAEQKTVISLFQVRSVLNDHQRAIERRL